MAGGDDGFDAFFWRVHPAATRVAVKLLGRVPAADEVVVEAFTGALARWRTVSNLPYPNAWVLRGGASFWLMGLTLVDQKGQPARRWRCGLRTLLIWLPVAALLVGSLWLDAWYWSRWPDDSLPRWILHLSLTTWWGAYVWLLGYAGWSFWMPAHLVLGRWTGLYLVLR